MRPRSFEEREVVERLEKAFWSHGFEGLSLEQLTESTGLSRSSLYNAFGSKSGMMRAAVDAYAARSCARFDAAMAERPLRAAIERLLRVAAGLADPADASAQRLGCLIGNLIAERAVDDADKAYLGEKVAQIERSLRTGFETAGAEGMLVGDADPGALARFTLVQMQGLRLVARAHPAPEALADAVGLAMATIDASLSSDARGGALGQ